MYLFFNVRDGFVFRHVINIKHILSFVKRCNNRLTDGRDKLELSILVIADKEQRIDNKRISLETHHLQTQDYLSI